MFWGKFQSLLRRRVLLAAGAVAAAAGITAGTPASAEVGPPQSSQAGAQWACAVAASGQETSVYLPPKAIDELVAHTRSYRGPCAEYGASARLGDGTLTAFSQRVGDRPVAIGLIMSDSSLDGLPYEPATDGTECYDVNGDGTTDPDTECTDGYANQLDLNASFRRHVDSPFTYLLVNWNPQGHMPKEIYGVPHYDVHFYMNDNAERLKIRTGACGEVVNCDDYALGEKLPAAKYIAPDYGFTGAVAPAMGNHLIDQTGPEFNGQPFTRTWIYGTWNGENTFDEAMVTRAWYTGLRDGSTANGCYAVKLPSAWQKSGWYPTKYCLTHRPNRGEVVTSLEDFVYRTAS